MALPPLPTAFLSQMQAQLNPVDFEAFLQALAETTPVSIRWNPRKARLNEPVFDPVPWNTAGCYLPERPVFTLDPRLHGGAYYVQEASSMLLSAVLAQTVDLSKDLKVLDLAAAPGGKSTLLAASLGEGSLLLSNEVIKSRYQILQENLCKWGDPKVLTTNLDTRDFAPLQGRFDVVVLDAPCSGEGLFRKDPAAIKEWSPEHVLHCAARQRRILAEAGPLLQAGGILIYSTCTYNEQENGLNLQWAREQLALEPIALDFPQDWRIQARDWGYQCYPHQVRGEGFFIAALRQTKTYSPGKINPTKGFWKPTTRKQPPALTQWVDPAMAIQLLENPHGALAAIPAAASDFFQELSPALKHWDPVLELGILKQQDFIPAHALALSGLAHPALPRYELKLDTALQYLRKESIALDAAKDGWGMATYADIPLGWLKSIKGRINNYYPKAWRIRMQGNTLAE